MSFEANSDRSIHGIYSLFIGVAIGSLLGVALPAVFESLVQIMNEKISTIGFIGRPFQYAHDYFISRVA